MKKILSIILAVVIAAGLACTVASADEFPQPEGGMKFEGRWAIMNGLVWVVYEEEGYRVSVELYNQEALTGEVWEYACYYSEEKDVLESVSSMKHTYSIDAENGDMTDNESEYEGFDEEGQTTVFAINSNGNLTWSDGHENAGADLEFRPIGDFGGIWQNEAEEVYVEIEWEGLADEETFFYFVFIRRGGEEQYTEFTMTGMYNPETDKLECTGSAVSYAKNAEGGYDMTSDDEIYDAFFSAMGNGKLLFEAANGIELEFVDPAMENG